MNNNATKVSGHTELPWKIEAPHIQGHKGSFVADLRWDSGRQTWDEEEKANATFIVRCCNEWQALNAVAEAANYLESTICGYNTIFSQFEKRGEMPALKRFMEALAVLAKLRNESK